MKRFAVIKKDGTFYSEDGENLFTPCVALVIAWEVDGKVLETTPEHGDMLALGRMPDVAKET